MREGTKTRTATEIAEAIDFIGGSLSVSAGQDYCAANAQMLAKDLETGLGLFADVLLNPVFSQREIDREREQRRAALESIKEEASGIASLVFNKSVYGLHPYGRQTLGTRRSLAEITRDDLVAFHEKVFVPDNAILVAVGDFQSATMLQRIQETFGAWPRGVRPQWNISSSPGVSGRKVTVVDKPDATQTQIRVGNVGIDIRNPDRFALEVASTVFGGGFTSRLVEEIRVKRSLTYGAWCGFPMNLYGGSYVIGTFTKNETLAETIDVILAELSKLRERGVTKEELQKAQNYLAGDFARGLQTPEALASQISDIELYGFPGDYLETYIQNIRNVQLAEVSTVIKKYFRFDDLVFVLVGPADKACAGVEKYGIVNTMTLDEVVE
jgi:predicted Zn-dependent peptidase